MAKALILVVDPSTETRKIYSEYFTFHGYEVLQAADGVQAERLCGATQPDVIVTELSDHTQWVQSVQRNPYRGRSHEAVIIACSTRIDASWPFAPAGIDVDCAFPKPTPLRTLLDEIDRLLTFSGANQPVPAGS